MNKNFIKIAVLFLKALLIVLVLAIVTITIAEETIEPHAYNFVANNMSMPASNDTVVIAVDDKSIAYHRWPWPREYFGKIIKYLREYSDVKVIGLDAIVQNRDTEHPDSDKNFFDEVRKTDNLFVAFVPLEEGSFDETRNRNYNKKFAAKFKDNIAIPGKSNTISSRYKGLSEFPDEYFNSIKNLGSVKGINTEQYALYMPQIIGVDDSFYASLALKMYMYINSAHNIEIAGKYITAEGTPLKIPYIYDAEQGTFLSRIKYYGLKKDSLYSHKQYSASDIIESYDRIQAGKKPIVDPSEFRGKTVFIGTNVTAVGSGIQDVLQTPIQKNHPGVDIQATNFDNIQRNEFIRESTTKQDILICTLVTIITLLIIIRLPMLPSLFLTVLLGLGYLLFALICYVKYGYYYMFATPIILQTTMSIFGYSYKSFIEGQNKEKIQQAMGKYLSQDIMKNVVQNIDDIKLGGKRAYLTVLFADIRGFTSMSEKMPAEEVSKILNEYFTEIEPIITSYNGVINKFIGDAVMAIFGEPIQDLNHPVNAVKCAYAMLKKVEALQDKWLFEGKPKIEIGIGINTGEAFVGNIGSEKRLEYTVIGDTVNLASRIESYNKIYHTNLLVSTSTYSYISDIANVIKISDVTIRGKSRKMDIYEVLKLNEK